MFWCANKQDKSALVVATDKIYKDVSFADEYVLNILNTGSIKSLETLCTVGHKRAQVIHDYREIYGQFQSFEDLYRIPSLTKQYISSLLEKNLVALWDSWNGLYIGLVILENESVCANMDLSLELLPFHWHLSSSAMLCNGEQTELGLLRGAAYSLGSLPVRLPYLAKCTCFWASISGNDLVVLRWTTLFSLVWYSWKKEETSENLLSAFTHCRTTVNPALYRVFPALMWPHFRNHHPFLLNLQKLNRVTSAATTRLCFVLRGDCSSSRILPRDAKRCSTVAVCWL